MEKSKENILFKKFKIINCLKKDTVSCVYLADHIYLNRKIILKTLDTNNLRDKIILERFKREGKILAALDHPNIIKVFDFGNWKHYFYISFEYFPSENLRVFLRKNKLNNAQKESIIIQVVSALKIAHKHHIVHRDLKPENILVNNELDTKIADFGLALMSDESSITLPTSVVGTPAYMSPEQIRGETINERSDLFSLGIIIYELYRGKNPFLGKDAGETLNNILTKDIQKIMESTKSLPQNIQLIISHLLQREHKKRYSSAQKVLEVFNIKENMTDGLKIKAYQSWLIASAFIILILIFSILFLPVIKKTYYDYGIKNQFEKNSNVNISDSLDRKIAETSVKKKDNSDIRNNQDIITYSHVKKESTSKDEKSVQSPGELYIECQPWAYVYLDSVKIDSTPMTNPIQLEPKQYALQLLHPQYPIFRKMVDIKSKENIHIKVDFDSLVGFLNCNVYPWGRIYINGQYKGETPFKELIRLKPGNHKLKIMNPQYKEYEQQIKINRQDTLNIKFNFELHANNNELLDK